jgi:hypothetical protein
MKETLAGMPLGPDDPLQPSNLAQDGAVPPESLPSEILIAGPRHPVDSENGPGGEQVFTLEVVHLRELLSAAETKLLELEKENRALSERLEKVVRNGSDVIREIQEDAALEMETLKGELALSHERLRGFEDDEQQKKISTLRVMLKRAEDTAQDLQKRYDILVMRDAAAREDNRRLLSELSDLRQRYESFASVTQAQVRTLSEVIQGQAAALKATAAAPRKRAWNVLGKVIPSLIMAPIGLQLCVPAFESFVEHKPLPYGGLVCLWAGVALVIVSILWALLKGRNDGRT